MMGFAKGSTHPTRCYPPGLETRQRHEGKDPIVGLDAILHLSSALIDRNHAAPQDKFVFLGVWILGSAFILWTGVRLKRVRMDERQLHVSNYFRAVSYTHLT